MVVVGDNNHHEKSVDLTGNVCERSDIKRIKHHQSTENTDIAIEKPKAAPDSILTSVGYTGGGKPPRGSLDVETFPSAVTRGHANMVRTKGDNKCHVGHRPKDPYDRTTGLTINLAVIGSCEPIPECPRGKRQREQNEKCVKTVAVDGYGATPTGCRHEKSPLGPSKNDTGAFSTSPPSLLDRMKHREKRFGSALSTKDSPRKVDGHSDDKQEAKYYTLSCDANGVRDSEERPNLGINSARSSLLSQRDVGGAVKGMARATPSNRRVRFVAPAEIIAERTPPAVMEPAGVTSDMAQRMARRADRFGVKVARPLLVSVICTPKVLHPSFFCSHL